MKHYVNPCKVITGVNTRWSYANVWEPKSINGGTPKYSVSLIIPKSDAKTVEKIRAAIKAAYQEGEGKLKGNSRVVPALEAIKNPLRNGDLERPTPIPPPSRGSWMPSASTSWSGPKCTAGSMAGRPSASMLSTAMGTKASPAA